MNGRGAVRIVSAATETRTAHANQSLRAGVRAAQGKRVALRAPEGAGAPPR